MTGLQFSQAEEFALDPRQVHIWQAALDVSPERLASYQVALAPSERERAERFRFLQDRHRFTVGRGILRSLLGGYLGLAPGAVPLTHTPRGKPYLAGGVPLAFNLSHSQGVAIYAFAWEVDLGVDLEILRPVPEAARLAARFFSAAEAEAIAALPEAERSRGFFRVWTRKEAYLKATGEGIPGLGAIEVSVAAPPEILAIGGDRPVGWSLCDLDLGAEVDGIAALALGQGATWPLSYRQYPAVSRAK